MADQLSADATPEKRLFISLLTRDIPLISAFLDMVDNSVNAAVEPYSSQLKTAQDYLTIFNDESFTPRVTVSLVINADRVEIDDSAGGISAQTAADHVFKFGRPAGEVHEADRLSVYGIGLKRAMFKLGNSINMRSNHIEGGFDLKLNVSKWAMEAQDRWTFPITRRAPVSQNNCGTKITVTDLHEEVKRRISDGVFEGQLKDAIARTYSYYMAKFIEIRINQTVVEAIGFDIGSKNSTESFEQDGVSCSVTAGIGTPQGSGFRDKSSGWFVFCNGRAVVSADKSPLTGWGSGSSLPIFQPKHRPFVGAVFFVSVDAEKLPWTTTKSGINEDSLIWQLAKRLMSEVGRNVVSFLDQRYTDEGTEVASRDLQEAAGERVNILTAAMSPKKTFTAPPRTAAKAMKIQYDALPAEVASIAKYLKRPGMSGSEVGRYTFNHFLRNEVEEK